MRLRDFVRWNQESVTWHYVNREKKTLMEIHFQHTILSRRFHKTCFVLWLLHFSLLTDFNEIPAKLWNIFIMNACCISRCNECEHNFEQVDTFLGSFATKWAVVPCVYFSNLGRSQQFSAQCTYTCSLPSSRKQSFGVHASYKKIK